MIRIVTLLVLATIAAVARAEPPGRWNFRAFGAERGLGNLSISTIVQTDDGLIWVGTEDGLYSYDGATFRRLDERAGLPSKWIHAVVVDGSGLWVGTDRGLVHVAHDRIDRDAVAMGLPRVSVNDVSRDPRGALWLATDVGVYAQHGERFVLEPGWAGIESLALRADPRGRVLATRGSQLFVRDPAGTWAPGGGGALGGAGDRVHDLAMTPDGTVWVRSARALWACDGDVRRCRDETESLPDVADLGQLYVDHAGTLWVTTRVGVSHLGAHGWEHLDAAHGLPTRSMRLVFQDREGSFWFAGDQLYQLLGRGAWTGYDPSVGLVQDAVWSITRDADGVLWVGGNRGVSIAGREEWRTVLGTENTMVRALAAHGATIYAANRDRIVQIDRTTEAVAALDGGPDARVSSLAVVGDTLWVATFSAGLWRVVLSGPAPVWTHEPVPGSGARDSLGQLAIDRDGRLWAAASSGLHVLDHGRWFAFTDRDGLLATDVEYLVARASGELCVSYRDPRGLTCLRYAGGRIASLRHLGVDSGLTSPKIYSLGEDPAGRLYVGSGVGLDILDASGLEHVTSSTGLMGDDCTARAFWADRDGAVWLGSTRGLSRLASATYQRLLQPPIPRVMAVDVDGVRVASDAPLVGRAGESSIALRVGIPTFANRTRLELQVRLLPSEPAWRTTVGDELRHAGLGPGEYAFEMRARFAPGPFGATGRVAFTVPVAWWQSLWFHGLLALFGFGVAAALVVWRARVMSARAAGRLAARYAVSFKALVEQSPDAVLLHRDLRVIYVNEKAVSMLGYRAPAELVGRGVAELIPQLEEEPVPSRVDDTARTGRAPIRETPMLRRDGTQILVEISAMRVDFDGGPAVLAIGRDCTERKALERRVIMSDRMASIGTLAAGIAHEINNPLAYIKANLAMIAEELPGSAPSPQLRAALDDALDGANRVEAIVKGVNLFSRAETEQRTALDVARCIGVALRITSAQLRQHCRVRTALGALPPVDGNEARLGQVFINLLVNAQQAGATKIDVATRTLDDGRAEIVIRDNGRGMPPEVARRVFEPFFTTKDIGEGTGLGLAVCHGIITSHGGEISVESAPGAGAAFRILLPPTTAAPVAVTLAAPDPAPVAAPIAVTVAAVVVADPAAPVGVAPEPRTEPAPERVNEFETPSRVI